MDLRERAVAAVEIGALSCHQAAANFGIGVSTRRLSGRGTWVRPAALRRGRWADTSRRPFPVSTRAWLLERAKLRDFTLRGLVAERGLKVDYRAVWTFIHPEKLSFKKTVVASKRDRPDVAHCRLQWRKYRDRTEPERLVFIETSHQDLEPHRHHGQVRQSETNAVRQFIC
jgi:transposase